VTLDEAFVKALVEDYDRAPLSPQDRVMLDYVGVLTKDATRVTPDHHRRLREAGFDDRGILQITLIASWFNYINRVADALGVGRGPAPAEGVEP
jgi:alkylhydroperoxidase family enzyme